MADLVHAADDEFSNEENNVEIRAEVTALWSAPLPRPEVLAEYNQAFPGCAERIVAMAEEQSRHRRTMEATIVRGNVYSQKVGLWLGFFLALIVISCGAWLVYSGRAGWGAGLITLPLVSLVSVFVFGKREQRKQLEKAEQDDDQKDLPFPP